MPTNANQKAITPPQPIQLDSPKGVNIPHSEEAERAVLGAIITNPVCYYTIAAFLKAEDFFVLRCRYVYEAMQKIAARDEPAGDYALIVTQMKADDTLKSIGGPAYLTGLVNDTPTSVHGEVYARLVERAAIRRAVMNAAAETIKIMADESIEVTEAMSKAEGLQMEAAGRLTGSNTHTMKDAALALLERTEMLLNNPGQLQGIPTGFTDLDRLFLGFDNQSFTLFGGRPGMGKTSLLLSTALNMAKAGYRVGLFSMEMGIDLLMLRLAAMEGQVNAQRVRTGELSHAEWMRVAMALTELHKLPIFVDDSAGWTPQLLKAKCTSMKRRQGIDIFMIDYVGLMNGGGRYKDNKVAEAGFISRSLKGMARDLRTPVWGAIQLSRECEKRQDKRPQLSDLRESGDWEQDADNVLFIYRDEVYNPATEFPNQADIIVAKHRQGPTGTVPLYFEKSQTRFMNGVERTVDFGGYNLQGNRKIDSEEV